MPQAKQRSFHLLLLISAWGLLSSIAPVFADDGHTTNPEDASISESSVPEPGGEARELFDGETLNGWEGNLDWFRVEDGAIVAGSLEKPIPRNEFLCTREEYENFELRLEVKLLGKFGNAGIQIRSQRVPDHHEMIGYQADVGMAFWGSLYDESRRNRMLASPNLLELTKHLKQDDWNEYIIRCEGKRVQLWLNGFKTVDYTEEDESIEPKGVIGLQIHGGPPSEAWYRNIRIRELGNKN